MDYASFIGLYEKPAPGSDRVFGFVVEKMHAVRVDAETKPLMHLGGGGRLDRGDHRHAADRDVEEDLGAEPLDDLDHGVERQLGRIGIGGDMQILRANA